MLHIPQHSLVAAGDPARYDFRAALGRPLGGRHVSKRAARILRSRTGSSIRKASELLDIAPSSVSRKVALLEQQIGTVLLERTSSGVRLTHAGVLVADYARSVVLDYDSCARISTTPAAAAASSSD